MKNNTLLISAAGSGKTTYLVNKALSLPKDEIVLITTYTEANEIEIRKKILAKRKSIPSNIKIQTWFSFLIQHGVRPFQGSMDDELWENEVKGMLLEEGRSGKKYNEKGEHLILGGYPQFWGEDNFKKFFFTPNWKICSDKISKFVEGCNKKTNGDVISRISRIYPNIFIDEVQDLAGFDLELIKLLFQSNSNILLVGDPRQVTYLTHHSTKNKKYKDGKIKDYLLEKCKSLLAEDSIDEETLIKSHRNNKEICDYSSKLYEGIFEKSEPCECEKCRANDIEHIGIFAIKPTDVDSYLEKYNPVQLRWNARIQVNNLYKVFNLGEAKGQTHNRVLIYPTANMLDWIKDNSFDFTKMKNGKKEKIVGVREKFYVAITRAKYSVGIVIDYNEDDEYENVKKYTP